MEKDFLLFIQMISAAMTAAVLAYFMIAGKKSRTFYSYILFQGTILFWIVCRLLSVVLLPWIRLKYENYLLFQGLQMSFVNLSSAALLVFILSYTGGKFVSTRRNLLLLLIPPVAFSILALTGRYHRLYFGGPSLTSMQFGLLFWFDAVMEYGYAFAGIIILFVYILKKKDFARKQALLIAAGILSSVVICFAQDFYAIVLEKGTPVPGFDLTIIGFFLITITISMAAFRYNFLNLVPLASKLIVSNMDEAILILDAAGNMVKYNASFSKEFSEFIPQEKNIKTFIRNLTPCLNRSQDEDRVLHALTSEAGKKISGEIHVNTAKFYHVNIQPIFLKPNAIVGKVASFADVTPYKELLGGYHDKNLQLVDLNRQLAEYASTVEELTKVGERNRIARDIHDTLGHTMTMIISLSEAGQITCRNDPEKTRDALQKIEDISRNGLIEVRHSVEALRQNEREHPNLMDALEDLFSTFRASGVQVDFYADGLELITEPVYSDVIRMVCTEALTNSLRHGKAESVSITVKVGGSVIKLYIMDDGSGCREIKSGFGLAGMKERVESLNGTFVCGSDGESGFNIRAEIPVGSPNRHNQSEKDRLYDKNIAGR